MNPPVTSTLPESQKATRGIRADLTIGVLAVQGDVREHLVALTECGVRALAVRRPSELEGVDGLVLPGGESTVIDKLSRAFGLAEPIRDGIRDGLPVYGSCAGMILLAKTLANAEPGQQTFGGLDVTVRRNAFGRQVESFEADLEFAALAEPDRPVRAVFIRAPWVERMGPDVEVLATVPAGSREATDSIEGRAVAVRQGNLLATSFHPEVAGELRVHELFVDMVRAAAWREARRTGRR